MMHAKDLMNRAVSTVPPEMTLGHLARFFMEERVHGAPVVDRDGHLIGVVSMTDLVTQMGESEADADDQAELGLFGLEGLWGPLASRLAERGFEQEGMRVSEIMSRHPLIVAEDWSAARLARCMLDEGVHRLVVTRGKLIQGIVSATDLLRALAESEPAAR